MKIERIAAARLLLANRRPYLSVALWSLLPVPIQKMGTFAVDKYWRLYYDPELDWDVQTTASALYHETFHLLRDHPGRQHDSMDGTVWNVAADCEINDDIEEEQSWSLPQNCVYPSTFNLPEGQLAEWYYEQLIKNAIQISVSGEGPSVGAGRCGSCAGGPKEPWEKGDSAGEKRVGQAEGKLIARRVAEEIARHKDRGDIPGGWVRWAEAILNPQVDWRRELRALIFNAIADVIGKVDYTYRRPSRRQSVIGDVVLPSMTEPVVKVAVVVDTSGSMSEEDLNKALAEVKGILTVTGVRDGVTVLSVDAAVHSVQKVFSLNQIKLAGGGGTDMGIGIAEASNLRPAPNIIVVLTDGYTPWPEQAPRQKVIVGIIGEDGATSEVPGWAKTVRIS